MTFDPNADAADPENVQERVDTLIEDNEVVLFMKGNELMPQCGYSKKALQLLTKYRDDVVTEDVLDALDAYRAALESHSGWETIPQTFVDGEFIGGSDILEELDNRGELHDELGVDADDVDADDAGTDDAGAEAPF
ncbi:glutaredoxin [Natronomonas pharaonis DSM 2160]|uniref:Glutaredoxin n=1 Tax=Natronomonas pharaonis (strain ATCC 35678 / DSM 2160 / CIP 103997 / JCM 8858 / NBRC 14720 / NCIMB 2260 / Gabara) TaxID=348780 RepID=A0A1U7EVQ3_NATPD|nr:glutaredoxin domain-containing protein [Natronomonas pharaonis]CAI49124.1 glutaredoxin [Natronomonas pharaonis DSM 2160]